ncbi:hypothetical protein BDR26DRAFT_898180 [Obelidium mucronatum]|nr:hypothetical protein BDR26DRAFT_898180 [Obelidium mucronatum]
MLSGPIPSELGYLKKLRYLSLKQNSLSGNIPPELGNNRDLERLYLYDNSLEGSIPESFGNLTNLLELWLNDNKLSGTIPTQLGLLSNIFALHLERNQLSGTIPNEVINLPNLQSKDFSGNDIILTTTGILAGDYQLFSVLEKVSYVLILLNALVLAGLIAFALQYEANSQIASGGFQIRRALTNFNITLGAMGICVLLLIVTDLCTLPQELQVKGTPQNIITFVLVATFELCFIKYSFSRSANIIESIFPRVSDWLTRSSDHIDPRFMIIAQYGAVASVLCFSTSFVIFAPTWDPFTFKCFSLIAFILLMGVTVALFAMKLRLYFNSQLEQKVLSSNYKRAKDIAEGRASELGKTASYYKGGSTGSGRTTSGRIPSQIPADSSATTLQGNRYFARKV